MAEQSENENSIDEGEVDQFRELVKEYIRLPVEIKEAEEPAKQLKARFKEVNEQVMEFMKAHNYTHCNIPEDVGGGMLLISDKVSKEPVKKDHWNKGVSNFLKKRGIDATYDDIEEEVNSCRETKVTQTLKKRKK